MKIVIITDGDNVLGMGHIYQSLALADALTEQLNGRGDIFFMTKSGHNAITRISESGYSVYCYQDDNSILNALKNEKPDRIIFDKLDVAPVLARRIKETINAKLVIFTNLTTANQSADIAIMAGMGSNFNNIYDKDKITGKVHFWGPKYWLLRPEFYEYHKKKKKPLLRVKKVMLIFGGADPSNITSGVLSELLHMDDSFEIIIALGDAFLHQEELTAILTGNRIGRHTVQVVTKLTNVAETMHKSDIVFVSPGMSFFEALMVRTPVLCFHQNKFQYDAWKEDVATIDISEIVKLPQLVDTKAFIFPDDSFVTAMEIGKGRDQIIYEILN